MSCYYAGCIWGDSSDLWVLSVGRPSYVPTVKTTHKSLETSQKHPERIRTQRQLLFLHFGPYPSNLRSRVKLSYKVLKSHPTELGAPVVWVKWSKRICLYFGLSKTCRLAHLLRTTSLHIIYCWVCSQQRKKCFDSRKYYKIEKSPSLARKAGFRCLPHIPRVRCARKGIKVLFLCPVQMMS